MRLNRIVPFLILTFSVSWGFEALIAATITQPEYLDTGLHPLGMFVPAFTAIILQMFFVKSSPFNFKKDKNFASWVLYGFIIVALLYGVITILALLSVVRPLILQGIGSILVTIWTLGLFAVYSKAGKEQFQRLGIQLGNFELGFRFIVGVVLFLLSQALLNWIFGLGSFPGIQDRVGGIAVPQTLYPLALIVFFFISVIGTPLSGLAVVFGEEYGWRGFLLKELKGLGPRIASLLVGLVWGIWHFPIILSGVHTYPPNLMGLSLGVIFFTLVGFLFGYAVIKTDSIWVAAFMHGVLNSLYAFILQYLVHPDNAILSFGLGVYGIACLFVVSFFAWRDPIWDGSGMGIRVEESHPE